MEMTLSATDLYSHMVILGLAAIIDADDELPEAVVLCWKDPETAYVGFANKDLGAEEAALSIRRYINVLSMDEVYSAISRKIMVGKDGRSPLSPRIGNLNGASSKDESESLWDQYYRVRQEIIDAIDSKVPAFLSLVGALGMAAYWAYKDNTKKEKDILPDKGASLWEMAPRNRGSEFMTNKYLKILGSVKNLYPKKIESRLSGALSVNRKEDRNTGGFRAPSHTDDLLSFLALHGISSFSVRPIAQGSGGSHTDGTVSRRAANATDYFAVPIATTPIVLEKFRAVCRSNTFEEMATAKLKQSRDVLDAGWLKRHAINYGCIFERVKAGTINCPEYYVSSGQIFEIN